MSAASNCQQAYNWPLFAAWRAGWLQVSDDIRFGRDDDDETKIKALEYFLPKGEQVGWWGNWLGTLGAHALCCRRRGSWDPTQGGGQVCEARRGLPPEF